ncbi:MAG TPA: alkaline phosphatase family protein [Telmatospirillum sp.]|nr:alkaline phosphatase family protein [Telmatospirillum sp.]
MKRILRSCSALVASVSLLQVALVPLVQAAEPSGVTAQPSTPADISRYVVDPASEPALSSEMMAQLLRKKIKYVFVIFNENHSFDNEFGTFPGVNGLYSDGYANDQDLVRKPEGTPGFTQTVTDAEDGISYTVTPFKIGPAQGSSAVDSVDHSHGNFANVNGAPVLHTGLAYKIDVDANNAALMDKFAQGEFNKHTTVAATNAPAGIATAVQYSRLVMSHTDCDTTPFMWHWANHFAIFDNIFATEDTPSTPNAVAMIAGQAGETQWVKHGTTIDTPVTAASGLWNGTSYPEGTVAGGDFAKQSHKAGVTQGVPLVNDPQPFYGSQFDVTTGPHRQPSSPTDATANAPVAANLTFASLPLTFLGKTIVASLNENLSSGNPKSDLADIQNDIPYIAKLNNKPVNWRWYEEGYDLEATDASGTASQGAGKTFNGTGKASHAGYVLHHNGAAYFGYIANTPKIAANLRGMTDFFTDVAKKQLPQGGVFYIRGGYVNQQGLASPVGTNKALTASDIATVQKAKNGDDDHPSYTDRQISEAMMARVVNAVAGDPKLWAESAIIITYDESDGFYDHVPPRILSYGPDGLKPSDSS